MRNWIKGISALALVPIAWFFTLCVLLYVPPIQDIAKRTAIHFAEDITGWHIGLDRLHLRFPMSLIVEGCAVSTELDHNILTFEELTISIKPTSLLYGVLRVDEIGIRSASLNTLALLPDIHIEGNIDRLLLNADKIDLIQSSAQISNFELKGCNLLIDITDTTSTAPKPDSAPLTWAVRLKQAKIEDLTLRFRMPTDSLFLQTHISKLLVADTDYRLSDNSFAIDRISLKQSSVIYQRTEDQPRKQGFNPEDIQLRNLTFEADSVAFTPTLLRGRLLNLAMTERCGLEVQQLSARFLQDPKGMWVDSLQLLTNHSSFHFDGHTSWIPSDTFLDQSVAASLRARIAKQDLVLLLGDSIAKELRNYPTMPLDVRFDMEGDRGYFRLTQGQVILPGAFEWISHGTVAVRDTSQLQGEVVFKLLTKNLYFVNGLLPSTVRDRLHIPSNLTLSGVLNIDNTTYNTNVTLRPHSGSVNLRANYDSTKERYNATLAIKAFPLQDFLPKDSLLTLSTTLILKGEKIDPLAKDAYAQLHATLDGLDFVGGQLSDVTLDGTLAHSRVKAELASRDPELLLHATVDALARNPISDATVTMDMEHIDLHLLNENKCFQRMPLTLSMRASTTPKESNLRIESGDLSVAMSSAESAESLLSSFTKLTKLAMKQIDEKAFRQAPIVAALPKNTSLKLTAGAANLPAAYLSDNGIEFKQLSLQMDASPTEGLRADGFIYAFQKDSTAIDTLTLAIRQPDHATQLTLVAANGQATGLRPFHATLTGELRDSSATVMLHALDGQRRTSLLLGLEANQLTNGVLFRLIPNEPILAYRHFRLNEDNRLMITSDRRITADINLHDSTGMGLRLRSLHDDAPLQTLEATLTRISLKEICNELPFLPPLSGQISAQADYEQTESSFKLSAQLSTDSLAYDQSLIGNLALAATYLPAEENRHRLTANLLLNTNEVLSIAGDYTFGETEDEIDAKLRLTHLPLTVVNGFIPQGAVLLNGDLDGTLAIGGNPLKPTVSGNVIPDSVSVFIPQAGARFRLSDAALHVSNSRLTFDRYSIFTQGKNPFEIDGTIDFTDPAHALADIRLRAENFELLNAARTKESLVYGKVFINLASTLVGPLDALVMRGDATLLGATDVTYVLRDSPLSVDDRLGDLVTFVNFNDTLATTATTEPKLSLGGLDMLVNLQIAPVVRLKADLSPDRESRVELQGGGDLSLQYTPQGDLVLTGRYTLTDGLLKYSLPVLPSKTFSITNGSFLQWNGNPMDPTLNITAVERVRTSVTIDDQTPRQVNFDVSIALKNSLDNLGLSFNISAPEDLTVENQLAVLTDEERSKQAITMLATGIYTGGASSKTGSLNMGSALNSFLQNEINNLAAGTLKNVDINLGVENNNANGSGTGGTDYSFSFAKRFYNDRISILIGGKISTGDNTQQSAQSFIDNLSVEYRLDNSGTRYIKLFHNTNYESILEGEVVETGAAVVLRRKMTKLRQLFLFNKKTKNPKPVSDDADQKK